MVYFELHFMSSYISVNLTKLHLYAFTLCTVVPGIPEVFVQETEYAVTELSWQLKCKNGIIKQYHVTYFNEDDNSDKKSLATNAKETKVRIEKLAPGETFVFQVKYFFFSKYLSFLLFFWCCCCFSWISLFVDF